MLKQSLLLLKAMRPHQWVKNLLVFAPFVLAHEIRNHDKYLPLLVAFVCMCFMASAVYLLNDLIDAASDRLHPVKKFRPIAAGALSKWSAATAACCLMAVSLAAGWAYAGRSTAARLAAYAVLTLAYTLKLKQVLMADVIVLSFFYTLRIMTGGAAAAVPVSPWLLAFSFFFFSVLRSSNDSRSCGSARRRPASG